jgi:hypothetical protein
MRPARQCLSGPEVLVLENRLIRPAPSDYEDENEDEEDEDDALQKLSGRRLRRWPGALPQRHRIGRRKIFGEISARILQDKPIRQAWRAGAAPPKIILYKFRGRGVYLLKS